jgi:colanic acid/amylovoran biosynthesis protein
MELSDQIQLQYISSIDTAFLEKPQVKLPADIEFLANEKIIIFVPNSLTWHYAYQIYSQDIIDNFYVNILSQIQHSFPEHKIVMLPQLCSIGAKGDYYYFTKLQNKFCNQQNIIVLDDQYSSDVQQTIIRNATLVIGSRYHSIVFAINNNVPFVAINYEHKIAGLLELLHLSKYQVDITNIFSDKTKIASALSQHAQLLSALSDNGTIVTSNANQIALQCFNTLLKTLSTK